MDQLNPMIEAYTAALNEGTLREAYSGIIRCMRSLRKRFEKEAVGYSVSSLYEGLMDMTYFALTSDLLRGSSLKLAVVYVHRKGSFELWISGKNRSVLKRYENVFFKLPPLSFSRFHEKDNRDAIMEFTLVDSPDFSRLENLEKSVLLAVLEIAREVEERLVTESPKRKSDTD